jgi:demethoxyubiquinone hydroxylase (CLK1/Coq7/Cat5 family)
MSPSHDTTAVVDHLNALLRGELSAVETYEQAIVKTTDNPIPELALNRDCHARRVRVLSEAVRANGGRPDATSGVWGTIAEAVTGGAAVLGRSAIIAILEEGEDRGLKDYRQASGMVDEETQREIEQDLLPAQKRTHKRMSLLSKSGPPTGSSATAAI